MAPDLRDGLIDFVHDWAKRSYIIYRLFIFNMFVSIIFLKQQKKPSKVREARNFAHRDNCLATAERPQSWPTTTNTQSRDTGV